MPATDRAHRPAVHPRLMRGAGSGRLRMALLTAALSLCSSLYASRSEAYPWMIRHGHDGCAQCHMDPSGSGLLTSYGREQGDEELTMRYRTAPASDTGATGPAWGLLPTPEWLLVGAGLRGAILETKVSGAPPGPPGSPPAGWRGSLVLMQADLRAGVRTGGFRASASVGVVNDGSYAAVAGNLVSREHWLGYAFDHDTYLVRAGRMNLPFGIRSIEHTLWVRQQTRTDINDAQQHGLAFAYNSKRVRAEVMGILGNYQISPDAYRQRGYSASIEVVAASGIAVGASSLITRAARDFQLQVETLRQAHGLFARVSPVGPLVILAEADLVRNAPTGQTATNGIATAWQGDVEPLQGLHFILTGETWTPGGAGSASSYGAWGGIDWFCFPQVDLRLDFMWRRMAFGPDRLDATALLLQGHVYL